MRWDKIRKKNPRFGIGLMSGSSCDGVDAALVRFKGTGDALRVKLIAHETIPYPNMFSSRLLESRITTPDIGEIHFEVGQRFADAALQMMARAEKEGVEVDFIASHGHTLAHVPTRLPNQPRGTLQVGEAAIIAERTGLVVVSDFRPRDMAAGGQGAPLVPYADWVLFHRDAGTTVCLNIGGIANVTVVTPALESVYAFDTGPGNMPIDGVARIYSKGRHRIDPDGSGAARGQIIESLLEKLSSHPFFAMHPPKSTGREEFDATIYLDSILEQPDLHAVQDVLATVTKAVSRSIVRGIQDFVLPDHDVKRIIVSGGGAHNRTLIKQIRAGLSDTPLFLSDDVGMPGDAREALAFAILGNEFLCGVPSNVPKATGAKKPTILGKVCV